MAAAPLSITKPKLLLGEGREEVRFFTAFLKSLGITDIQVEEFAGKNKLAPYLKALAGPPTPGFSGLVSLAVTRDADLDAFGAFASVQGALQVAGLNCPAASGQFTADALRVGVFILPDGNSPGMLEDLCLASVQADSATVCVNDFIRCIQGAGLSCNNLSKARLHTWLASRPDPDKRLGEAAESGFWPFHNSVFDSLGHFLRSL